MLLGVWLVAPAAAVDRPEAWPAAAREALVATGVVGTGLVEALAAAQTAAVVVVYAGPPDRSHAESIAAALPHDRLRLRRVFRGVPALAATITRDGLTALARDPRVVRIDLDVGGGGSLAEVVPLVGLDDLHAQGFGGLGVTVALLDTGADLDHPDLADSIVAEACFCTACCPNGMDVQLGPGSAEDDHGHGTNVAGVITSNGGVSAVGGAPDADLVLVKVLDSTNSFCCSSDVIAGLDWIIDQRPDVDVVNLSLGTTALFTSDCDGASATTMMYAAAIGTLRARGVLVFAASGNDGSSNAMAAPACVADAVAVAASDDLDAVLASANTNASTDLVAPGANVQSTGSAGGTLTLTGTSQASALASACAATLMEARPQATADDVDDALVASSTILVDPKNGQALPRLDCAEADALLPEPTAARLATVACVVVLALRRFAKSRR